MTPAVLADTRDALLRELTDWSRAKRKTPTKRGSATVNRYMAAIGHGFSIAVREWQWMNTNPLSRVTKPIDLRVPFQIALEEAGITDFRWHDIRHCTASYLAMGGASLPEFTAVLGHKQLDMVRRYARLSPQHTAKVVATMNDEISGSVPDEGS